MKRVQRVEDSLAQVWGAQPQRTPGGKHNSTNAAAQRRTKAAPPAPFLASPVTPSRSPQINSQARSEPTKADNRANAPRTHKWRSRPGGTGTQAIASRPVCRETNSRRERRQNTATEPRGQTQTERQRRQQNRIAAQTSSAFPPRQITEERPENARMAIPTRRNRNATHRKPSCLSRDKQQAQTEGKTRQQNCEGRRTPNAMPPPEPQGQTQAEGQARREKALPRRSVKRIQRGGSAASTCCRAISHDLPDHRSESGRSPIERVGAVSIQPDPPGHKSEPGGSFRVPGRRRGWFRLRRSSALSRRCVLPLHRIVNSAPPQRLCLPDIVPAEAFVRAGKRRNNSECGVRGWKANSRLTARSVCSMIILTFIPAQR